MTAENSSEFFADSVLGPALSASGSLSPSAFRRFTDFFSDPCLLIDASGILVATNAVARTTLRENLPLIPGPVTSLFSDSQGRVDQLLRDGSRTTQPIPGRLTLRGSGRPIQCFVARLGGGAPGLILRLCQSQPLVERFIAHSRDAERGRGLAYEFDRDHRLMGERMRWVEQASLTDALTGLGNRTALQRTLEALERISRGEDRRGSPPLPPKADFVAVVMDMDRLKQVNDSRGHRKGDQVLTLLARSIVKRLRGTDKCFRTGGDEFVVIAQSDPTAYRHRFTALAKDVNQALVSGGFPETGMSWGLASREEVESLDALIPLADSRMYDNKRTRCSPRAAPPALGSKQMPLP